MTFIKCVKFGRSLAMYAQQGRISLLYMSMVHGGHDGQCNRCPSSKTLISFSTSSFSSNLETTFGSLPNEKISKSNTPYAQISVFGENFPYKMASGACLKKYRFQIKH